MKRYAFEENGFWSQLFAFHNSTLSCESDKPSYNIGIPGGNLKFFAQYKIK
jgi:hypothetical protein